MNQGFPEAIWYPSPNFGYGSRPWNYGKVGRPGDQPIRVVMAHTTEINSKQGSLNSLSNVPLDRGLDSAHYLVAEDSVYQLVDDRNVAWHGGSPNSYTIGIETVGRAGSASTWSPGIIRNWGRLAGWLSWAYQIPLDYIGGALGRPERPIPDRAFVAHGAYSSNRSDPGVFFPWPLIRQEAVSYLDQTSTSAMMAGLDPSQITQPPLQGHPQEPTPTEPPPGPAAPPPQVAGAPAGPVLGLLLGAVALAWWANK